MLCYLNAKFLTKPTGFLKIFQVVISLTCLGLYRYYPLSFGGNIRDIGYEDRDILGKTTIGGMVVVTLPILVANVFSDGHSLLSELLHSLLGCVLYAVSSGFLLSTYLDSVKVEQEEDEVRKAGIAMGSLCVVNSLMYALDSVFTFSRWRLQ